MMIVLYLATLLACATDAEGDSAACVDGKMSCDSGAELRICGGGEWFPVVDTGCSCAGPESYVTCD